jgi:hypothetical protein
VLFCWTSLYCTLNFLQLQSLAIPLGCLYQFCSASMIHSQSSLFILKKYTYLVFNMSCQLHACYAVLFLCFFFCSVFVRSFLFLVFLWICTMNFLLMWQFSIPNMHLNWVEGIACCLYLSDYAFELYSWRFLILILKHCP